jgi:phosphoribosyl 1,2-cyclic phosphate phosphodiesterase
MSVRLTILGCGSSGGVPRVGSGWGACDPRNPKNRRRRCSILVERAGEGGTTIVLVDTSPDLREQLLSADVRRLDAVLFTHEHADHVHGIDDLRPLVIHMRRRMPVYADHVTGELLASRFGYCFHAPPGSDYPPILQERRLVAGECVTIDGPGGVVTAMPFPLEHGRGTALGFRFGDVVYAPDVSAVPDESLRHFGDLELLILDALRYTPHPTHFSVEDALALIERMKPRRAVLTNLHTDLDHDELSRRLPPGIEAAYDGLTLTAGMAVG